VIQKTVNPQIESADAKGDRQSFHSLRHNFRDALREADVSRDAVLRPSTVAREIAKVCSEGLSLPQLSERRCSISWLLFDPPTVRIEDRPQLHPFNNLIGNLTA
jgi:hypothetical protein